MKIKLLLLAIFVSLATICSAIPTSPVAWSSNIKMTSANQGDIEITATIEPGYHLYGTDIPDGGPTPTSFEFKSIEGATLVGEITPSVKPHVVIDTTMFNMKLSYWENKVVFTQHFKLNDGSHGCCFDIIVRNMACNDKTCTSPQKTSLTPAFNESEIVGSINDKTMDSGSVTTDSNTNNNNSTELVVENEALWAPVEVPSSTDVGAGWLHLFVWGFIGGLLALLTPCVWPMIPLTVSFFLKRSSSRRKSVLDAVIYGVAIIAIYLALGLIVTLAFGAGKLNELATNAVFNLIFFAILVIFAISFFGAFDIKLPSKWSNSVDSKAERTTGFISMFFMAFTLVLVSFSCTGPLIGTLLVEAASQGSIVGPAIGMGAFALALALPFALFAIFPSMLKGLPKSGGWLNSVKVVLGFLELILSLKFLSVVDLAYGWGILDREIFLSIWIVLFIMLGMYLIGKIRFSHDAPLSYVSIPRFFLSVASFGFAVYLLPGLWGAPLKGVSAFVPPLSTQDFSLYEGSKFVHFDDYDKGMTYAAEHKMPVLLDFSGYGCVNCRKMEGAVLDEAAVKNMIENNFVFITLMVDDRTPLDKPRTITDSEGKTVELETVGELWTYLQTHKFAASVQPFYIILNNEGQPVSTSMGFTEDSAEFLEWLDGGLSNYKAK